MLSSECILQLNENNLASEHNYETVKIVFDKTRFDIIESNEIS